MDKYLCHVMYIFIDLSHKHRYLCTHKHRAKILPTTGDGTFMADKKFKELSGLVVV